jgi:hypothetical protein
VVFAPARAPRVLTVRATREHMSEISAVLNQRDAAACEAPAPPR